MQGSFQIIILYVSERRLLQGQKASKNCSLTQYTEIVQRPAVIGPMQGRKKKGWESNLGPLEVLNMALYFTL